jgi:Uma2 family endonuclease
MITGGGIDKLEVYRRLGVKEVWFWQNQRFEVYHLQGQQYALSPQSVLLPNLDLAVLAEYAVESDPLAALLAYRQRLRQDVQ